MVNGEGKPLAVTVRLARYVPGWLSNAVSALTLYPTEIVSPLTTVPLGGKSAAGAVIGVTVTSRTGELPSLALTITVTAGGSDSPALY
jgi:hypothetical protein